MERNPKFKSSGNEKLHTHPWRSQALAAVPVGCGWCLDRPSTVSTLDTLAAVASEEGLLTQTLRCLLFLFRTEGLASRTTGCHSAKESPSTRRQVALTFSGLSGEFYEWC